LGEGEQWVKGTKAGWKAGRRLESLPHIGHDTEDTEKNKPRRTRRTRKKANHGGHGGHAKKANHREHGDGKRGGGLRWSERSCGPDGVGTPVPFGIVSLCRRDRRHGKPGGLLHKKCRHGKPGGLLHWGRRVEVERAGVRAGWYSATPYVWRVCGSAGVTAGMASLAAGSTGSAEVASFTGADTRGRT
jgi:hypothetical protein